MAARLTVFGEAAIRQAIRTTVAGRTQIAEEAAADARASAPVLTGRYRNGIHVEVSGDQVAIVDDDPDAIHKEYGTSDTEAHAALTDAARARGRYTGMQPR